MVDHKIPPGRALGERRISRGDFKKTDRIWHMKLRAKSGLRPNCKSESWRGRCLGSKREKRPSSDEIKSFKSEKRIRVQRGMYVKENGFRTGRSKRKSGGKVTP